MWCVLMDVNAPDGFDIKLASQWHPYCLCLVVTWHDDVAWHGTPENLMQAPLDQVIGRSPLLQLQTLNQFTDSYNGLALGQTLMHKAKNKTRIRTNPNSWSKEKEIQNSELDGSLKPWPNPGAPTSDGRFLGTGKYLWSSGGPRWNWPVQMVWIECLAVSQFSKSSTGVVQVKSHWACEAETCSGLTQIGLAV